MPTVLFLFLVGVLFLADDFLAPGIDARRAATQCGSREPDPVGVAPISSDVRSLSAP